MFHNVFVTLKKVMRYNNKKIQIADNSILEEQSRIILDELLVSNSRVKDTDIKMSPTMKLRSQAREKAIDNLCDSGSYSLKNCLVIINPYGFTPLSLLCAFHTEEKLSVKAWVECEKDARMITELPPANDHRVPIMGLFSGSCNYINVELYKGKKRVKRTGFTINTEPLPEDMEDMVKIEIDNGPSAYRFYYVSGVDTWFPYVFDYLGRVRYYFTKPSKNYGVFPMSGGMLFHSDRAILKGSYGVPHSVYTYKMDAFGRTRDIVCVKNGLHHDMIEMWKGGNYLCGTSSLKNYCEDAVAELDVKTGKQVKTVNVNDIITEPSVKDSADWAHLNTVSYSKEDNTVLVCLRNLHSVLKINWETGELMWILGDPFFWKNTTMESYVLKPVGDNIKWFYQAHSSFQMPNEPDISDGHVRIAIYDNHWQSRRKTENFDNDKNSYGLVYDIDEDNRTVTLYKSFESAKSTVRSNVVYDMEDDRMLLMSGCLSKKGNNDIHARIYDYEYSSGKLIRVYAIKEQFYRAYPFEFDYKSLSERVDYSERLYGDLEELEEIQGVDISDAVKYEIIEPDENAKAAENRRSRMKTRAEKEAEWEIMTQGKTWEELDHTERIKRTRMTICRNILYLYGVDHLITHLYLVSDENTYMMDYTKTYQEVPAIFYNYGYYMPVPLQNVKPGKYKIYVKCFGKPMFDVDRFITI